MENKMFCFQCQETAGCKGCTQSGVCGKKPEVAAMQDLLIYATKGLSAVTARLREEGKPVARETNHLVTLNLFATITNANFDEAALRSRVEETLAVKDGLLAKLASKDDLPEAAVWNGAPAEFAEKASQVGILSEPNEDIRSLRELITYGLKGLSAYLWHANVLGKEDDTIDAFQQSALASLLDDSMNGHADRIV